MGGFHGTRATGDWGADVRPTSFREGISLFYPNGDVKTPLTALTSQMTSQSVNDPQFSWWEKLLATQRAAVTGTYSNTSLATAYVSGGVAGTTIYVKMSAAGACHFRVGHQVLLRLSTDANLDTNGLVVSKNVNGASSYIGVRLLEADDNSSANDLTSVDTALIIGNANAEMSEMPEAVSYDSTKRTNYTEIFMTSLALSRTQMKTKLRTGDAYKEMKRESLELHMMEIEKAFLWGIATEGTGDNGKPRRTTMGLIPAIKAYNSAGVSDFTTVTGIPGQTWLQGGENWLDTQLEVIFRYGSGTKFAFAGSGAILGINRLAKQGGQLSLSPSSTSYGLKVREWVTPFGSINFVRHPLFSYEATNRNSVVVFEPDNLKYNYIDDTFFVSDDLRESNSGTHLDGKIEGWTTECGLEYHFMESAGYLTGFNTTNTSAT